MMFFSRTVLLRCIVALFAAVTVASSLPGEHFLYFTSIETDQSVVNKATTPLLNRDESESIAEKESVTNPVVGSPEGLQKWF